MPSVDGLAPIRIPESVALLDGNAPTGSKQITVSHPSAQEIRLFFGDDAGAVLEVNDLFYVRYDGDREGAQKSLEAHRDGSLVSFR